MEQGKFILSMLVNNESGVLTRISGLFARRGYNIDSLSVGETQDKNISRMTIMATGDEYIREQITRQVEKLHDVHVVELMDMEKTVMRELMLIKVAAGHDKRSQVQEAVDVFRAKVVDLTSASVTVEITGEKAKLDAFVAFLEPFGITELCRTGITAIGRGAYVLNELIKGEDSHGETVL